MEFLVVVVFIVVLLGVSLVYIDKVINSFEDKHDAKQAVHYLTVVKPAVQKQNLHREERQKQEIVDAISGKWDRKISKYERRAARATDTRVAAKHLETVNALKISKAKEQTVLSNMISAKVGSKRIVKKKYKGDFSGD